MKKIIVSALLGAAVLAAALLFILSPAHEPSVSYDKHTALEPAEKIKEYSQDFFAARLWELKYGNEEITVTVYTEGQLLRAKELLGKYEFVKFKLKPLEPVPSELVFGQNENIYVRVSEPYTDGDELMIDLEYSSLSENERVRDDKEHFIEANIDGAWYTIPEVVKTLMGPESYLGSCSFCIKLFQYPYDFPPGLYRLCVKAGGEWYGAEFTVDES